MSAFLILIRPRTTSMKFSFALGSSTYGFCIYDTEGDATRIYGGYIYGIDDLENIVDVLDRYGSLSDAF